MREFTEFEKTTILEQFERFQDLFPAIGFSRVETHMSWALFQRAGVTEALHKLFGADTCCKDPSSGAQVKLSSILVSHPSFHLLAKYVFKLFPALLRESYNESGETLIELALVTNQATLQIKNLLLIDSSLLRSTDIALRIFRLLIEPKLRYRAAWLDIYPVVEKIAEDCYGHGDNPDWAKQNVSQQNTILHTYFSQDGLISFPFVEWLSKRCSVLWLTENHAGNTPLHIYLQKSDLNQALENILNGVLKNPTTKEAFKAKLAGIQRQLSDMGVDRPNARKWLLAQIAPPRAELPVPKPALKVPSPPKVEAVPSISKPALKVPSPPEVEAVPSMPKLNLTAPSENPRPAPARIACGAGRPEVRIDDRELRLTYAEAIGAILKKDSMMRKINLTATHSDPAANALCELCCFLHNEDFATHMRASTKLQEPFEKLLSSDFGPQALTAFGNACIDRLNKGYNGMFFKSKKELVGTLRAIGNIFSQAGKGQVALSRIHSAGELTAGESLGASSRIERSASQ